MQITPSGKTCGATVSGIDLGANLSDEVVADIRAAWLKHQVLSFVDQALSHDQLETFASRIGPFGNDPFIKAIDGRSHIVEVRREPDEQAPLFADNWHSDWSFQKSPPAATLLYANIIPPTGGDTLFANLYAAWDALPSALKKQVEHLTAVHSARRSYSPRGRYGEKDRGRSMRIISDDSALLQQHHPLIRQHPETGRKALFLSAAYTVGIVDMPSDEARTLLTELCEFAGQDQFVYRMPWQPNMLTLWDNRCLNHMATGGYDGHRRLLYRITIGDKLTAVA